MPGHQGAQNPRLDALQTAERFHPAPPQGDTALSQERFTWPTISRVVEGRRVVSGHLVSPAVWSLPRCLLLCHPTQDTEVTCVA